MFSHRMRVIELIRLENFGYSLRDRRSSSDPRQASDGAIPTELEPRNRNVGSDRHGQDVDVHGGIGSFANSPDALASKVIPSRLPCPSRSAAANADSKALRHFISFTQFSFSFTWLYSSSNPNSSSLQFQDPVPSSTQTASGRASARPLKNGVVSALSLIKSLYAPFFSVR